MTLYFLSYARADQATALRFADQLIAAGVSTWIDQYDIRPSQHWDRAVETAVRGCRGMIVMLSPRSVASTNVADEVSVAMDEGKDIIPILVEPCVLPLRMTRMQYIDASQDPASAIIRCLAVIAAHDVEGVAMEPSTSPTRSPLKPEITLQAERHLTSFVGPIARILVRKAAAQATSRADLYQVLAQGIDDPGERKSFLGWIADPLLPEPAAAVARESISPGALSDITRALTHHLGPIAAHLISRERAGASSRQDLCRKLAARIADEADRKAFLNETGATG